MSKNSLIVFLSVIVLSCADPNDTQVHDIKQDASIKAAGLSSEDTTQLKYRDFRDTKWIVGEVGVNGEKPDSITFSSPDTLTYISTDTGTELCKYFIDNDTLVFYSHSVEADMIS